MQTVADCEENYSSKYMFVFVCSAIMTQYILTKGRQNWVMGGLIMGTLSVKPPVEHNILKVSADPKYDFFYFLLCSCQQQLTGKHLF